ncbi:putative transcription factor TIFY family [Helianthus annuus]|nr:putative transcription factor TIFY family [Helianthus annuus]
MTIFYSGKVNVYDDVPADKAQALFQLAASPLQFSQEDPLDGKTLQSPSINAGRDFPSILSPVLQTVRMTDNYRLHKEENHISREDNSGNFAKLQIFYYVPLLSFRHQNHYCILVFFPNG